ncbi:acetyltransferase [Candidatus Villigracilis saccharophilus]|uniref:acetyltransferase n=1 Tax=Candidatus Villigracilis saccharophilus TaxID=3140684 RepID=UPI00313721C3|nr:acetyltransferase [Anaerolineales bacterium]
MLQKIVILGAGNFGRETLDVFNAVNKINPAFDVLGFLDDNEQKKDKKLNGKPVLGGIDWLIGKDLNQIKAICGVGEPHVRRKIIAKAEKLGAQFCNVIHPAAVITDFVDMGVGIVITAGCILTCNITIKDHVHLNLDTTIGHDVVMEKFATTAPGVHISGQVDIGEGTYFGTGAVVVDKIKVGEWTIVGAGAVVAKSLPANVTAVGVPAKVIKIRQPGWHLE